MTCWREILAIENVVVVNDELNFPCESIQIGHLSIMFQLASCNFEIRREIDSNNDKVKLIAKYDRIPDNFGFMPTSSTTNHLCTNH